MPELKTMGDLRKFLAVSMQDVRNGKLDQAKAGTIAKLASQINASVHAEIAARTHMEINQMSSFNLLAITDGVEPAALGKHSDFVGEREPNQELTEEDWGDIDVMLNKKRYNVTKIAGLYKVDFKVMRDFIDDHQ